MLSKILYLFFLITLISGCKKNEIEIINNLKGIHKTVFKIELNDTKRFLLDSVTARRPRYMQLFMNSEEIRYFTFLNCYTNSIYIYDYQTLKLIQNIFYTDESNIKIRRSIEGYHIKNLDSIYLYNRPETELLLISGNGNFVSKISLRGKGEIKWFNLYPQYYPQTVTPFIELKDKLILTGQYFESIPENNIENFSFDAHIDFKSHKVNYIHTYPNELYGFGYNWNGGRPTTVYPELHPDGDKLIYSFPVSHDIYITNINSNSYNKIYGGSNFVGSINSIRGHPNKTSKERAAIHYIQQDWYTAIRYDVFKKVYYRFLLKGITEADNRTKEKEKSISVIIMDENFNYLGETEIGNCRDWYWQNSFVTKEGLNIEYLDNDMDEKYITIKIFTLKKI